MDARPNTTDPIPAPARRGARPVDPWVGRTAPMASALLAASLIVLGSGTGAPPA